MTNEKKNKTTNFGICEVKGEISGVTQNILKKYCTTDKYQKDPQTSQNLPKYEKPEDLVSDEEISRYKIPSQEKKSIREEFSNGITVQRINDIIINHTDDFDHDFIEDLQAYYNESIRKNIQKLSFGVNRIDKIVKGFENMIYLDRSISKDSIKKIEFLINREVQVIKDWRKPRRERISGVRIKITEEGIKTIKDKLKSGITIQRLSGIINDYVGEDNFIQYIKQIVKTTLESREEVARIHLTKMKSFITNWENILYRGHVISESDFNKLKMIVGEGNPISHKIVYGKRNLEAVKLVKNEAHAELIGTFIRRGSIRTDRNDLYISFNSDDSPDYISHLENLITKVFGRRPSMMKTRDRFYISGPDVIQYLTSQGLSNENRRVPSWIKKPLDWIQENSDKWKKKYLPLVIACLNGMVNASSSIKIRKHKNKYYSIGIALVSTRKDILKDFRELCESLDIKANISGPYDREDRTNQYYLNIGAIDQVKRFLIDIVKPLKWDLIENSIQQELYNFDTSIEEVLEITPELKDLRRKLMKHQKQDFSFRYNPNRVKNIKNLTLKNFFNDYLEDIDYCLFPQDEFKNKINPRASSFKFKGEQEKNSKGEVIYREELRTVFIKKHLLNISNIRKYSYNNLNNEIFRNLLDIVRSVFIDFKKKGLGIPWHEPILKRIMVENPNAIVSELPVWKITTKSFCIGHIDLGLIDHDTFYVSDLKDDESDAIRSLPQIIAYGIMIRDIISKVFNLNSFNLKCLIFTKDDIWIFDPISLRDKVIDFVKYTNSLRKRNLKSLRFSKGLPRTDLLSDLEDVFY